MGSIDADWVELAGEPVVGEWVRVRQRRTGDWLDGRYQRGWELAAGGWQLVLLTSDGQTRYEWSTEVQRRARNNDARRGT